MSKKKEKRKRKQSSTHVPWTTEETRGFLILSCAIVAFLSLLSYSVIPDATNLIGLMGHTLGWALQALIGLSSYFLILYVAWIGWRRLFSKSLNHLGLKNFYVIVAIFSFSLLLSVIEKEAPQFGQSIRELMYPGLMKKQLRVHLGGAPFYYLYSDLPIFNFHRFLNITGASLIFTATFVSSLIFLFKIRLSSIWEKMILSIKEGLQAIRVKSLQKESLSLEVPVQKTIYEEEPQSDFLRFVKLRIPSSQENTKSTLASSNDLLAINPQTQLTQRPSISQKGCCDISEETMVSRKRIEENEIQKTFEIPFKKSKETVKHSSEISDKMNKRDAALISQSVYNGDFTHYKLPSPSLLTNAKKVDQSSLKKDLKKQAEVLEETLLSFGIEAKVGQINCGPTVTSFEVHPAIGVKVQKIKTLDNDIALNMEAKSIRIIAPIPGKAAVGIEVPNAKPQEVSFKEMVLAYQERTQKFHIPILLGQAVNGDYVMTDLTKMPHCIIAGATGSGKSVCINSIIMSIVLNAKPDQIKLVMVDPKKVELTPYTKLPHMLAPVITESQGAAAALNWLVREMENRYEILKLVGARNIDSFNKRTIQPEKEASLGKEIPLFMPYIVGIIDELADLMMVASQDIETPIARIAQMARAVGIHLVLATQRPSREVITGLIKANFPTRISFKVASRVNSQIVLDEIGAESLLGNGDMLFLPPGSSTLIRAQGAFVRDEDIAAVVSDICQQAPTNYVIQSFDKFHELGGGLGLNEEQEEVFDTLYEQAKDVVLSTGNASTTFLQRKLKIGYARAASLMDQLEKKGIVGPIEGSKPRKIFAKKAPESEEMFLAEEEL